MAEPPPWDRVKQLFHAALDVDAATRAEWLRAQDDDDRVIAEVDALLAAHEGDTLRPTLDEPGAWHGLERIGPYRIGRELAHGGMGRVFEATRENPRRRVALKVLKLSVHDPRWVKRFEYESQILADLAHPNIAHVYESGTLEGDTVPWYAMELIDGAQSLLDGTAHLDRAARIAVMLQVCDAVHHAHLHGVVHRDLKPANVLVDCHGTVKLIDFGVAKAMSGVDGADLTTDGVVLGTLAYMSPEQAEGRAVDGRVDVYALGVMLYQLCTDQPPYVLQADKLRDAIRTICEEPPAAAPLVTARVPEDLRLVIAKCLEKDPSQRYASVAALAGDLRAVLGGGPVSARPPSLAYQLGRFARRHRGFVAAASIVVVTSIGATVVSTWGLLEARSARARAEAAREQEESERLAAERARSEAEAARRFATELLYAADPWRTPGGDVTVDDLLARASARLDATSTDPRHELWARETLMEIHHHLGRHRDVEREARRAIVLAAEEADLAPIRLHAMRVLALAVAAQGQGQAALELARDTLRAHEAEYGTDDPRTWEAMAVEATCLQGIGELKAAAARHHDVADRRRERWGADNPDTVEAELAVAEVNHALGDLTAAQAVFREVWERRRDTLGPEHPETLAVQESLGRVVMEAGDPAQGESILAEVERTCERILGPDHERTLAAGLMRAAALRRLGRAAEAVPLVERALAVAEPIKGPTHPDVLIAKNNLALTLGDAGELERSERLYLELVETWRTQPPDGAGSYLVVAVNYANVAKKLHHTKPAVAVLDEFLARARLDYPDDLWLIEHASSLRASLVGDAVAAGRSERARAYRASN